MNRFPQVILFDLDDTLLDNYRILKTLWPQVCAWGAEQIGVDSHVFFQTFDEIRIWFWNDGERHRIWRQDLTAARTQIMKVTLEHMGKPDDVLAAALAHKYATDFDQELHLFDDAIDTLQRIRRMDIRMGLITNGAAATQRHKIEKFQLAPYFEHIFIEGERGVGKPDPSAYCNALDAFDVKPHQMWIVGDNFEWEVAAPQRLGIAGIWVDHAGVGVPLNSPVQPFRIVRSVGEIIPKDVGVEVTV